MNRKASGEWFEKGLRFTCTQCGNCCTGEPGFVWVDDVEIRALAEHVGEDVEKFRARYVATVDGQQTLKERKDGSCVFFRQGLGCTVYGHRPRQCRSWPFWNSNIRTERNWQSTMQECPGAGHGQLYTVDQIKTRAGMIDV